MRQMPFVIGALAVLAAAGAPNAQYAPAPDAGTPSFLARVAAVDRSLAGHEIPFPFIGLDGTLKKGDPGVAWVWSWRGSGLACESALASVEAALRADLGPPSIPFRSKSNYSLFRSSSISWDRADSSLFALCSERTTTRAADGRQWKTELRVVGGFSEAGDAGGSIGY